MEDDLKKWKMTPQKIIDNLKEEEKMENDLKKMQNNL
jgi:hypothetical protein